MKESNSIKNILTKLNEFIDENIIPVPIRVVFDGTVFVKADNIEGARELALEELQATLGEVVCDNADIDWDIDIHGEFELKEEE